MKKRITVLTATRAEYGLLRPIIKKLNIMPEIELCIVVTGMHLSVEHGLTYKEIEKDNYPIDKKIEILLASDSSVSISKAMGLAMISFAEYFEERKPDLLVVLGDRYETLAVCCAAMNAKIPIAHLYGGETTEGAIDECIRHSITKMSYLHFSSVEEYRKRIIQLGEDPKRVFNVGAIGIENILKMDLLSKEELEKSIDFNLEQPYAVVTFHPVTLERENVIEQIEELLIACSRHNELKYIFTKSNSDAYGITINAKIKEYTSTHSNSILVDSLGTLRYLSALKYSSMVIGNSSSGLIEAPSFLIPTINIGDRQKGRLQCDLVINCDAKSDDIDKAICLAQRPDFLVKNKEVKNPYGDGKTSEKIISVIYDYLFKKEIELKKQFYNIDFKVN